MLGLCAAQAAIAAAAHVAGDDGRSQRMLGAPGGGVQRRIEAKAEDGLVVGREMDREAPRVGEATRPTRAQAPEAIDVGPAGDREAVIRYGARRDAIARAQRGAQQGIHLPSKPMMGIVQHHRAAATEPRRQTRLMRRVSKLAGGRPAIALQDVGRDGRTGAHLRAHGRVSRLRVARRAQHRVDESRAV